MDPAAATIIAAGISGACGIAGTIIAKISWDRIGSFRFRRKHHIYPGLIKTVWKARWFDEDEEILFEDEITFEKWKKKNQFVGVGNIEFTTNGKTKKYTYSIEGEVSPTGFIVLTYKAEKYPEQANIGMACLRLAADPMNDMQGFWSGRCSRQLKTGETVYLLRAGRLTMSHIK
ncbi:MAG: hypothetical protein IH830_14505 [Planctomycetes bacterium]|nr:hypothetical protein [Planctomycetota bacterium]